MSVVKELIRIEADGTISFGNYELDKKSKVKDFEHDGDLYKVKTFKEITKLERNDMFVYESVPGTTVTSLSASNGGLEFGVEGGKDVQVTVELEEAAEYEIFINGNSIGQMKTNLGGKLVFSIELENVENASVKIVKL